MENIDKKINSKSLNLAIILGIILLILNILESYYIAEIANTVFEISIAGLISVILPFVITLLFVNDLRNSIGGSWNFKQSARGIFILLLLAQSINFLGKNVIYVKLIDPQLNEMMESSLIKATTNFLEKNNTDQKIIDEKTFKIKEDFRNKVFNNLRNTGVYIIIGSLILGVIYKKKPFISKIDELELDSGL